MAHMAPLADPERMCLSILLPNLWVAGLQEVGLNTSENEDVTCEEAEQGERARTAPDQPVHCAHIA